MQPSRRSTIFLMELIMAILIFSLAATVCVQVFVKSHTLEKESTELSQAIFASVSVAEIIRSGNDIDDILIKEYSNMIKENNTYSVFFSENWNEVSKENAKYCLKITNEDKNNMINARISVCGIDTQTEIYGLEVKKYNSKEEN